MRFSVFSKRSSTLALALALGMGGVLSVTALEAPAAAQKKKKDDDKAAKPQYSKGFVAAYNPVQQLDKDGDVEAVKAALPGVIAAVENDDDRNVAGSLVYATGSKLSDTALRRQGLDMMLQSGKADGIAWWPDLLPVFERLRGHYVQLGLEDRVALDLHEGVHEIRVETGLAFLKKHL